ncbi:MAG: glutamate racemase [Clostridia bacterium]
MSNKPIGIFDSGLGGLTVLREIHRMMPGEDLVYFGDSRRAPYGTKSRETIIRFAFQDIRFLLGKGVRAVVIACNTVSSNALPEIIEEFDIPLIEVLTPGSEAGARASVNGKIGVIGTQATIGSNAYPEKIREIRADAEVFQKSCPLFVPLVEEGRDLWDDRITELIASRYLSAFNGTGIDVLILGCTHYPLLHDVIQRTVGAGVRLIDSARSVAARLGMLDGIGPHGTGEKGIISIYTSDSPDKFKPLCSEILGIDDVSVAQVDIEKY